MMIMTSDMWITLAILVIAIIFFVTELLRVDVVAIGVVVSLILTEILTTGEATAGFSNSAVITIAALFVVGGAVLQTGLADIIGRHILVIAGTNEVKLTAVIMITVALLSSVMSDTGTVAVLLPAIIGLAHRAKMSLSKLLIPLSFGSLLGGATTLIGTPPNIIVSDLLRETNAANPTLNLKPFEFFDYTPVGILILIFGIGFMVTFGRRLLPDYGIKEEFDQSESPEELLRVYSLVEKVSYLRVRTDCKLVGHSIATSHLRRKFGLTIVEILRQSEARPVAKIGDQQLVLQSSAKNHIFPTAETIIHAGDILITQGVQNDVKRAINTLALELQEHPETGTEALINRHRGIAEVVLPPRSTLIGKNLRETRFARSFNLSVLDIHRPGTGKGQLSLHDTPLEFGDALLVQGLWHDIMALRKKRRDFVVLGQPETMVDTLNTHKAPVAALVLVGMLGILVLNLLPLAATALLASLAMVLFGCLTMDEAYDSIDWRSVVLIAGMLPMATALSKVGLVDEVATQVTEGLGGAGATVVMAGLFLLTAGFTQVLSNTATAVLVAPIALETAMRMDVSPHPFLMTVAIAASMAFASPVASPVNTLVLGAGGYKFADYVKVGVPMLIIALVVTLVAVPIVFPF
jgi:di/tricarboxylate transporter